MDLETYSDDEGVVLKRRSVKLTLLDSDDEDAPPGKTAVAFGGASDGSSSSDDEDDSGKENSSLKANRGKSTRRVVARDSDSESDGEVLLSNFKPEEADDGANLKKPAATMFKDKDLYDDETSDHEEAPVGKKKSATSGGESSGEDIQEDSEESGGEDLGELELVGDEWDRRGEDKPATKPSRKLESRKAKTAAMEGIDLIHSETQRLLRESRLSLPYHRPKQHTIAEFLQRRSVRATAQERTANSQDLGRIWKELEERTKEAEAFYKSDSEDSDDGEGGTGEKQPSSSQDTVAGEPGASDALKDSGILSATNSFTAEASPPGGDGTSSEEKGAAGSLQGLEGPEDPSATQSGEREKVTEVICEEDNPEEPCLVPSQAEAEQNSPELLRRQQLLEVPCGGEEGAKAQETSPDLFLSQTQGARVPDKGTAPEDGEEVEVSQPIKATPRSAAAVLLSKLGDVKPRLSCGEGEVVDLTGDSSTPGRKVGGVEELISRFMKHAGSKTATPREKPEVGVSVVSVEKDADGVEQVKSDTVFVALEEASAVDPALAKPGAKLKRLKEELNKRIAKQREEEWAKKQLEFKIDEEEIDDERSVCGLLDDDREAELTDPEETEEEEDEEEDDVPIVEKKRTKSAFLDDEAEVSDDDEDNAVSGGEGDEEDEGGEEDKSEAAGDDDDDDTEEEGKEEEAPTEPEEAGKKPKLRRIKTFDMFEWDEEKSEEEEEEGEEDMGNVSTASALNIPPYQPGGAITQPPKEEPGSITPLLKVPVLKGVISAPNLNESSLMSPCDPPTQPVAADNDMMEEVNQAKKKLFNQSEFSTQENMAELMDVCSGTFSGKVTSELMGLCSGNFSTQPVNLETLEKDDEKAGAASSSSYPLYDVEDTQPMGSASDSFPARQSSSAVPGILGSQSLVEGQPSQGLLGHEDSNAQFPDQTPSTPPRLRLRIVSSDEEADEENALQKEDKRKGKKRKKKNMQLRISDDEDGEASDRSVGYDSEENEIDPEELALRRKTKATEFFEDEAELSESEWGSEDEDEQDLDKLEWEEGDAEKLNEKKVREQLEKIHMRRVLDEDQREVRILQELLLEDGEFHTDGPGRERKFRWRNINITTVEREPGGSDDENPEEGDEEEDELEWRKKRLERETFFMEQKEKAAAAGRDLDEEDDFLEADGDSQLLQLGKAALRRMRSFNGSSSEQGVKRGAKGAAADPQVSPNPKYPFRLLTKRGSFLARSEVALARIAHITRSAGATVLNGPKHSRNFVFAALSPEKVLDPPEERSADLKPETTASTKRKSSSSASLLQKKPRLSTGKGLFDHLEL